MRAPKRKPDAGGVRLPNALSCDQAEGHQEDKPHAIAHQAQIPSKAALARKSPRLRINRFTGAWCDDATGAKGADVESLRAFIARDAR